MDGLSREALDHAATAGEHDAIYTTAEAAAEVGISRPMVTHLAREHGLGRKFGKSWLFTAADLDAMRRRDTQRGPKGART